MLQGKSRLGRTVLGLVTLAMLASAFVFAPTAGAADALLPAQTLFETERVTPTGTGVAPRTGGALPENMVAFRGEFESFQLAVDNTTAGPLDLDGRIVGLNGAGISADILRVGMVNLPDASTGYGTKAGVYSDPLPPLRGDTAAGRLSIGAGQWGGVVVMVHVRTDAAAGDYAGTLELFSGPRGQETVYARQPFTLSVRNSTLMQSGETGAFSTTLGVEAEQYWLGNTAMRNGVDKRFAKNAGPADRMAQLAGLYSFLDERGITPLEMGFGTPDKTGVMNCAYDNGGRISSMSFLDQLKNRYFANGAMATRWFPYRTAGCTPDDSSDDFTAVIDPRHTASLKQDDWMDPKAPAFWATLAGQWSANGLFSARTYVKNPFDEPSDATATQRVQMDVELPKANIALHKALGSKAKVVLAGWPRDERRLVATKKVGKKVAKRTYDQEKYGNRKLWDKKGADDVDVWMVPFSRMFGRITPPWTKTFKTNGKPINRDREYTNRLAAIRKMRKGNETWSYNFYTGDRNTMQTVIDAPGTDPRLMYMLAAREGHTGLFISNLLMGWGSEDAPKMLDGTHVKNGNPYTQTPYFKHPVYGFAAGWGTYIYPGYAPALGLDTETDRNSAAGRPVSSLRLEAMRDGQEDANLAIMYRNRFGQKKLEAKMLPLFPNRRYRPQVKSLGQVVFPYYDNTNMAQRMEQVRRDMIAELAG